MVSFYNAGPSPNYIQMVADDWCKLAGTARLGHGEARRGAFRTPVCLGIVVHGETQLSRISRKRSS